MTTNDFGFGTQIRKSPYFNATVRWGAKGFSVYNHMYIPRDFGDPEQNFGAAFAIWDWIFGSFHYSKDIKKLTLRIEKDPSDSIHTLSNLYFKPFLEIYKIVGKKIFKLKSFLYKRNILRRA